MYRILVINPGSTSTKVSIFEDRKEIAAESVFHDAPELLQYENVNDQVPMRVQVCLDFLKKNGVKPEDIDIFIGRGGGAYPQKPGVTVIDECLVEDTYHTVGGSDHAAKLGVLCAWALGSKYGKPMYTLDPTNIDQLIDEARITGIKGIYRRSQLHALNHRAVAMTHAANMGKKYSECRFVVAHIDGGVTVAAHEYGKIIDTTEGAGGDGPFAPTRLGSVPVLGIVRFLEEGHTLEELKKMCSRAGGFVDHFGTSDADKVFTLVKAGDSHAITVWNAMKYQVVKSIGEMAAVLCGNVDAILLTGGLVRYQDIIDYVKEHCGFIAPIVVYPGEMEQEALCHAVLRALNGEGEINTYPGRPIWEGFDWDGHEEEEGWKKK